MSRRALTGAAYRPGAASASEDDGGEGLSDDEIVHPGAAGRAGGRGSKSKGKGRAVDDDDFIDDEDEGTGRKGAGGGKRKGKKDVRSRC